MHIKLESVQHFALNVCLHQCHSAQYSSHSVRYTLAKLTCSIKLSVFPSWIYSTCSHFHIYYVNITISRTSEKNPVIALSPFCCCPVELSHFSHSSPFFSLFFQIGYKNLERLLFSSSTQHANFVVWRNIFPVHETTSQLHYDAALLALACLLRGVRYKLT